MYVPARVSVCGLVTTGTIASVWAEADVGISSGKCLLARPVVVWLTFTRAKQNGSSVYLKLLLIQWPTTKCLPIYLIYMKFGVLGGAWTEHMRFIEESLLVGL